MGHTNRPHRPDGTLRPRDTPTAVLTKRLEAGNDALAYPAGRHGNAHSTQTARLSEELSLGEKPTADIWKASACMQGRAGLVWFWGIC